jgi:two-component system, cell cycle response regulator DivK
MVLLVHHTAPDRAMYADSLRAFGFTVIAVSSTDQGFHTASSCDVVITGLVGPGEYDGLALIERIRERWTSQDKPVIVLTASRSAAMHDRARAAGCDAVIVKPCLPDDLVLEVTRLVNHRAPQRA